MAKNRTGEAVLIDVPCPTCGNETVLCYLLVDEKGQHMHTRYVCVFWGSDQTKACDWAGWSVPSINTEKRSP